MPKTNLLDIVNVLETYADLYDMFDDNRLVYEALDKVNEELRAIPYVKAIPVKWIKDYIIPFQVHHDSLSEETKENDGAGWVVDVLETMLREWEKENE